MRCVVYCGTRNIYPHMETAAKTLIMTTKVDKVYFLIEDDNFPKPLPPIFECINVSNQKIFVPNGPNYEQKWTYMVLMRAALTKILPQDLDKVLSLDVDTIVNQDISDIWDIDLGDNYIGGVLEFLKTTQTFKYINMGVVMINLKQLRLDKKDDEIIDLLNTRYYLFNEQDCINQSCQGKMCFLPADYNISPYTIHNYTKKKISHFAGFKHWLQFDRVQDIYHMSWDDVLKMREKLC